VIVWDAGPYRLVGAETRGRSVCDRLAEGTLEIWLEGKKIRGGYALVHAKTGGDERNWLLIKLDDEGADARRNPVSSQPRSVLSGRTLAEVRRGHTA